MTPAVSIVDVLVFGEVLFDVYLQESSASAASPLTLRAFAGGAPANVAVGLSRLGCRVAFLGGFSPDPLGRQLRGILAAEGVNLTLAFEAVGSRTPLAIVGLDQRGEPEYRFYWNNTACLAVPPNHVDRCLAKLEGALPCLVHAGPLLLTGEPGATSTWRLLESTGCLGVTRSSDLNVRPGLWNDVSQAGKLTLQLAGQSEIVKLSTRDGEFLFGTSHPQEIAQCLFCLSGIPQLVAVTAGAQGALLSTRETWVEVPAFPVSPVDTTGAGDAFMACLLSGLCPGLRSRGVKALSMLPSTELGALGWRAAIVGALTTTTRGAMGSLPTLQRLEQEMAFATEAEFKVGRW